MPHTPQAVADHIRSNGGVLSYRAMDAAGIGRASVASALAAGLITRVRQRWFAVPDAPADVVRAARVGGSLTAASVADLEGVWLRERDTVLHVRVPRTASRLFAPDGSGKPLHRTEHGVCVHYRSVADASGARDPLALALAELFACGPRLDAQLALDSSLSSGRLDPAGFAELRRLVKPAQRALIDLADAGCQSGTETIVRLLLHGRRIRHRTQVWVSGVGKVDVLVGDRLVVEIDGEGFHTGVEFEQDRRRDFELVLRGYLVFRLSYKMVMGEWEPVRAAIIELVARGDHRWGARALVWERPVAKSLALQNSANQ